MSNHWVAALPIGLALGAGLGWWARGAPPEATPSTPAPPAPAPSGLSTGWSPPANLETCAKELEFAREILDAAERARVGVPVAFPPDLPVAFTPAGFERALKDALAACPDMPVALAGVDCTEFPCLASFTQPASTNWFQTHPLHECPAWTSTFPVESGSQSFSNFMTDAGPVDFSVLAPTPAGAPTDAENGHKRLSFRSGEAKEAAMEDLGGREFTKLESLDASIAYYEAQEGPLAELMLSTLIEQRAALEEAQ